MHRKHQAIACSFASFFLLTFLGCIQQKDLPAVVPNESHEISWGKVTNDLLVGLECKGKAYTSGSKMSFVVHVKNVGAKPIELFDGGWGPSWILRFYNIDSKSTHFAEECLNNRTRVELRLILMPGDEIKIDTICGGPTWWYIPPRGESSETLAPGNYRVTVEYGHGIVTFQDHVPDNGKCPCLHALVLSGSVDISITANQAATPNAKEPK